MSYPLVCVCVCVCVCVIKNNIKSVLKQGQKLVHGNYIYHWRRKRGRGHGGHVPQRFWLWGGGGGNMFVPPPHTHTLLTAHFYFLLEYNTDN